MKLLIFCVIIAVTLAKERPKRQDNSFIFPDSPGFGPRQSFTQFNGPPQQQFFGNRPQQQQFPGSRLPPQQQFAGQRPSQQQFGAQRPSQQQFGPQRPPQQQFGAQGQQPVNRPNQIPGGRRRQTPNNQPADSNVQSFPLPNDNVFQINSTNTATRPTTTSAPSTGPTTTARTTPSPQFKSCFDSCPTTSEYNPICGTNAVTYQNSQKLACAQRCGSDVRAIRQGNCIGLFPRTIG